MQVDADTTGRVCDKRRREQARKLARKQDRKLARPALAPASSPSVLDHAATLTHAWVSGPEPAPASEGDNQAQAP